MELPPNDHVVCHRHPTKPATGLCASCLRERLSGINPDINIEGPSTGSACEFLRSKSLSASFSASSAAGVGIQPHRRSCSVRTRNTLYDLLIGEDGKRKESLTHPKFKGLGFDLGIEICEDMMSNGESVNRSNETEEFKTMKEFIDLEWKSSLQSKKGNKYYGNVGKNLREVASVVGKRLGKWQSKQKSKTALNVKVPNKVKSEETTACAAIVGSRRLSEKEAPNEAGGYVLCRRSFDTYGRFSVDSVVNRRLSVDDSHQSCNGARASWDGCSIENSEMYNHHPDMAPSLLTVMEELNLKDKECRNDKSSYPGGTLQTRDYYYSARRKSFERSGSQGRSSLKNDELKPLWNVEVSPKAVSLLNGAKLLVTEKELRDSNWYTVRSSCSTGGPDTASVNVASCSSEDVKQNPKWWQGVWNIGSLMQRRAGHRRGARQCVSNKPSEGALPLHNGTVDAWENGTINQKYGRSYTGRDAASSEPPCPASDFVIPEDDAGKRKEETYVQRNRSSRQARSPNNIIDNGLLRLYLTPLKNHGKSRVVNSIPVARDVK